MYRLSESIDLYNKPTTLEKWEKVIGLTKGDSRFFFFLLISSFSLLRLLLGKESDKNRL